MWLYVKETNFFVDLAKLMFYCSADFFPAQKATHLYKQSVLHDISIMPDRNYTAMLKYALSRTLIVQSVRRLLFEDVTHSAFDIDGVIAFRKSVYR